MPSWGGCNRLTLIVLVASFAVITAASVQDDPNLWGASLLPVVLTTAVSGSIIASLTLAAWIPIRLGVSSLTGYPAAAMGAAGILSLINLIRLFRGSREPLLAARLHERLGTGICSKRPRTAATVITAAIVASLTPGDGITPLGLVASTIVAAAYSAVDCPLLLPAAALATAASAYEPPAAVALLALLPPPPPQGTPGEGSIELGEVKAWASRCACLHMRYRMDSKKGWAWILSTPPVKARAPILRVDMLAHAFIAGSTGAGKSRLAASIARRASSTGVPVLVVDPHGEYEALLPGFRVVDATRESINPFDPAGRPPSERAVEAAQLLASILHLGPLQQQLLREQLELLYEAHGISDNDPHSWSKPGPTIEELEKTLRLEARRDSRAAALATRIALLSSTALRSTKLRVKEIFAENTIVDLSGLRTHEQKRLYTVTLLREIYNYMQNLGTTAKPRLLIVLDEAHIYAPKDDEDNIVGKLYAEARKYGIVLLAVTQEPSKIHRSIPSNAATRIALHHTEPHEAKYMAQLVAGSGESELADLVATTLSLLKTGEALVGMPGSDSPLLVRLTR